MKLLDYCCCPAVVVWVGEDVSVFQVYLLTLQDYAQLFLLDENIKKGTKQKEYYD